MLRALVFGMLALTGMAGAVQGCPWKTSTGQEIDAAFVSMELKTGSVTLRTTGNSQLLVIPLSKLSVPDQEVAVEQWKAGLTPIPVKGTVQVSFPHHDPTDYHMKWEKMELLYPGLDSSLQTARAAVPTVAFVGPDEMRVLRGTYELPSVPLDPRVPVIARLTFSVLMTGGDEKRYVIDCKLVLPPVRDKTPLRLESIMIAVDRRGAQLVSPAKR